MEECVYIAIQDKTGDSKLKLKWDKHDQKARELAKKEFERLVESGYRIFSVKKVMGIFNTKGKEVKKYDPNLGIVYYEEGTGNNDKTFTMEEMEMDNIRYDDPKRFDPKKDKVDTERSYVATKPLRAG